MPDFAILSPGKLQEVEEEINLAFPYETLGLPIKIPCGVILADGYMWSNFCQLIKRRKLRGVLNKKDVSMSCYANQCGRGWRILRGGNVRGDAKRIYLHQEERRHIAPIGLCTI